MGFSSPAQLGYEFYVILKFSAFQNVDECVRCTEMHRNENERSERERES